MSIRPIIKLFTLSSLLLVSSAVSAQYKWINADGQIGYGDHVPPTAVKVLKGPAGFKKGGTVPTAASGSNKLAKQDLPARLQKLVDRFPVTLFTTTACVPCDMARQHLKRRGIPYEEKTVSTGQDLKAFSDLGFTPDTGLPVLSVGSDKRTGYHAAQWNELLLQSGFPQKSQLPTSYVFAEPQALAVASQAANSSESFGDQSDLAQRGPIKRRGPSGREIKPEGPEFRF